MGTRITDLPVATSVNPADVLPVVQSGTTKQAASSLIKTINASELTAGTLSAARLPAFTGDVTVPAGSSTTTLAASGVSAGNYGSGTFVPQITVDSKGRVTSAANIPISSQAGGTVTSVGVTSSTLAISGSPVTSTGNIGVELSNTGVVAGTVGSSSQIPVITTNAQGRITALSTAAVSALTPTGVTAGNYGSTSQIAALTVNQFGQITAASNVVATGTPTGSASGDLSGTYPSPTVARIQGRAVSSTTPTTNQVLKFDGTQWAPAADTDTGITQLTGDVTTANGSGVQNATVVRIQGTTVTSTAPTVNQVLKFNGTAWAPAADADTGITQLTGDVTTPSGSGTQTATLANSGVTAGTYGNSTTVPQVTVDAKGRVTAVTNVGITTGGGGTVTSVSGTGTVSGISLSGTVTTTGNLTLGGTLAVTPSNFASQTANTVLAAPNGIAGTPTFRALVAADVPTLNQNTTGTASNVTGTVAIANGGTGATTQQTAINGLAGSVTSGQYLRGNGTNVLMSAIQAADVPTLNQNTTGTASNVTGTVAIANGGTGATTQQTALNAIAGATTSGQYLRGNGTNVVMAAIQAADVPTLNQNTTGTASNVTGTVAIANGGTGSTTQQAALNAIAGAVTTGQFLRGNGTNVAMSAIQVSDVPTLNQNTTGTASNVTGTVAVANGGTGAATLTGYVKGSGTSALTASSTIPASDLTGTLAAGQFPALTGDVTTTAGSLATTIANISAGAVVRSLREINTIIGTAAASYTLDTLTQAVVYVTAAASANFTLNVRASSGTTLASHMSDGQMLTVVLMITNGATAYFNSSLTIDGSAATRKWINGVTPTSGNASSIDVYTYTIIKSGGAFTVLADLTKFA